MSQRIDEPRGRHLSEYRRVRPSGLRARWRRTGRAGRVTAVTAAALMAIAGVALALLLLVGHWTSTIDRGTWSLTLSGSTGHEVTALDGSCTPVRQDDLTGPVHGQVALGWVGVGFRLL